MWSVMNTCAAVLDYVCARMQVHAWRELACPSCDVRQSTRSALFDPDINKIALRTMQLGFDRRLRCNGLCLRNRKRTLFTKNLMLGRGDAFLAPFNCIMFLFVNFRISQLLDYKRLTPSHSYNDLWQTRKFATREYSAENNSLLRMDRCFQCDNCAQFGVQCPNNRLCGEAER